MDRSSLRRLSGTGAASPVLAPPTSTLGRPGRTLTWKASTAGPEMICRRGIFHSIMEAQVLYNDLRPAYNHYRPHSALNWLPLAQYAAQWSTATIE